MCSHAIVVFSVYHFSQLSGRRLWLLVFGDLSAMALLGGTLFDGELRGLSPSASWHYVVQQLR